MVQASGAKHGFVLVLILIVELCVVRTRTRTFSYCTPLATWMAAIKLFSSAMRRSHFLRDSASDCKIRIPGFQCPQRSGSLRVWLTEKKGPSSKALGLIGLFRSNGDMRDGFGG